MCCALLICAAPRATRAQEASNAAPASETTPTEHLVHVQVALSACPDAAQLQAALQPLLGEQARLQVSPEPAATGVRSIAVQDEGARYRIAVGDKRRDVEDPARDCAERARVAAVFIALNVQSDDKTPPAPPPPPAPPTTAPEPALRLALRVYGGIAGAPGDPIAAAAGLGASLERGAWRVTLDAMWLGTQQRQLARSDGLVSQLRLTRVPWTIGVAHHLSFGAVRLGPSLGLALDVLQLRGEQVTRPQVETRVNLGAIAALDLRVLLGGGARLLAQGSITGFPRAYRVAIDPLGTLARTPRLWLGASLGVEWAL